MYSFSSFIHILKSKGELCRLSMTSLSKCFKTVDSVSVKQLREFLLKSICICFPLYNWQWTSKYVLWDHCRRTMIYKWVTGWLSTTVAPSRQNAREKEADKLPCWLCLSLQGRLLHPYLFVSAGLTGATEQKRWHLVSTNEKWQMHKSFRLWCVEISVWHSLGLFGGSTDENFHGCPQKTHTVTDEELKWTL